MSTVLIYRLAAMTAAAHPATASDDHQVNIRHRP